MAFGEAFKIGGAPTGEDGAREDERQARNETQLHPATSRGTASNGMQSRPSYSSVVSQTQSPIPLHDASTETAKPARRVPLQESEAMWQLKEREAKVARQQYFREVQSRNDEWKKLKEDVQLWKGRVEDKDSEVRQAHRSIEELERALRAVRNEQRDTASLLETRTVELQEAQAFLTRVDGVSDHEVLQLVQRLNSTVYQTCANITAAFASDFGKASDRDTYEQACRKISAVGLLSSEMTNALRCFDHQHDSVLVQTALQAVTVSYTRWLCNTWDFRFDPQSSLQNVYSLINKNEPPSVAGRWRALGRKYIKTFLQTEEERHTLVSSTLAEHFTNILLACGVPQAGQGTLHASILRRFGGGIHDIVRLALEFQTVVGEQVVSRDLFAVEAEWGTPFDSKRMTDEWGSPKKGTSSISPTGRVLCSTELGLVMEKGGAASQSEMPCDGLVLLKPKAVLSTMLEELWQEQAQSQQASIEIAEAVVNGSSMDRRVPSTLITESTSHTAEHRCIKHSEATAGDAEKRARRPREDRPQ